MLLAELRARSAEVGTAPGGGLLLRGAPADLIEPARARKDEILGALRLERLSGERFESSALRYRFSELWRTAYAIRVSGYCVAECQTLIDLLDTAEEVYCASMEAGREWLSAHRDRLMGLCEGIADSLPGVLRGERLAHAVRDTMPVAPPRAAPAIVAGDVVATVACEGEASLFDAPGGEPASATPCAPAASPVRAPRNLGALS